MSLRLLLTAWLILLNVGAYAAPEPLVFLGDRELPPYEFLEDGRPKGANVDLAQAIGRVLGRPVEVRLMGWAEAQATLRAGTGHALTFLGRTPERAPFYDFSQPTFPSRFALFVRAERAEELASERMHGMEIGVTKGGILSQLVPQYYPGARLLTVNDHIDGTKRLIRGEIDALAAIEWTEGYLLRELNIGGVTQLPPFGGVVGQIAVRKGEALLLSQIDKALNELKASGEFDRIIDKWSSTKVHLVSASTYRTAMALGAVAVVLLLVLMAALLWFQRQKDMLAREVAERGKAEEALRDSQERLTFALEAGRAIGTWDWNVPEDRIRADARFATLFGVDADAAAQGLPREAFMPAIHPEDRDRIASAIDRAVESGGDYEEEFRVLLSDGGERWVLARGRCHHGREGMALRFPGVVVDVTERRQAFEHQKMLMAELDHRVKNILAVVQGLAHQSLKGEAAAASATFMGRLDALARAHNLVSESRWQGASLWRVATGVLDIHLGKAGPDRLMLRGPDVRLSPKAAQTMSLTLHELATNAAKYGALSEPEGKVDVEWEARDGVGEQWLTMTWRETGGPPLDETPRRKGFGTALIERALSHELGGTSRLNYPHEGLVATLDIPFGPHVSLPPPGDLRKRAKAAMSTGNA